MISSDTKSPPKKRGPKSKVKTFEGSTVVETPKINFELVRGSTQQDQMDDLVNLLKQKIENEGKTLDEALEHYNLSRKMCPVGVMKVMLKYTLANKVSLFAGITPEDRANYIRTADFEAFMEAVETKDRETQLAYSKVLRTDTQLNMNTSAPSMVINISEVRGLLQDVLPTIEAEFTEIPVLPQTSQNNDKLEEETLTKD